MKPRPWTQAELDAVRTRYATSGARALAAELGRSERSVVRKAQALGCARKPHWTPEEDDRLRLLWEGLSPPHVVARELGRSKGAVIQRATHLGLGRGVPQGYESIAQAAARTGLCEPTLRRVLLWAGVRRRRTMSSGPRAMPRGSHTCVDPFDVDEAVARWLATETVTAAAKRRGLRAITLTAWLREAKVIPEPSRGSRRAHRVPSEEIDRVIQERRERRARLRSVRSEAQRVGVSVSALLTWLREERVPRVGKRPWLVDPAVVDRIVAERCSGRQQAAE